MRLVLTLLARDNADVVDAHVSFHLHAGVDFVVATDNGSADGTREILERYQRAGVLHLIDEAGRDIRQGEWVTRMARLAARDFGADWVINSDADEFWWPRGTGLKEVLEAVPRRYGIVQGIWRQFVPRPDDGRFFAERMTVRLSPHAPINDPANPYRPAAKIAHRALADVVVGSGNHHLADGDLQPLRGWYPLEVLHFPLRSLEQCERKYVSAFEAWSRNRRGATGANAAYHAKAYEAYRDGRMADFYAALSVDDAQLERGLADGTLALDTRLRDALRQLCIDRGDGREFRLPRDCEPLVLPEPTVVDDAAYAVDAAALGDADTVRLHRRIDELELRQRALERLVAVRAEQRLRRLLERGRRGR